MTWDDYLDSFHRLRPGITESVLHRARDAEGANPYQWLAAVTPTGGRILDLACGSAPTHAFLPSAAKCISLDRSTAELAAAHAAGVAPVVRADATALPLATDSIDTVICSMALMLLTPLHRALAEIHRVLRPGGLLIATLPTTGPLRLRDLATAGPLLLALGQRLRYPNDQALAHLPAVLASAGFDLRSDERRRFTFTLASPSDARLLLDSLYLPGLTPAAHHRALSVLRAAAAVDTPFPIPLRRITARAR
ncbi:class I SAM-dependent methyltransferase [Streptomyces rubellomurinus]|uniref:class I SAM-dependent methyltransferase n=1 Tax=Streptomyces rubellomurinus (strain ATCC 31215) TaxID=359131 RepID=UPI0005F190E3|nr:class I SAM-dependent methyltransferase [Streptomyces rubellomurinus]